jgi:hypothetical protein
MFKKVKFNSHKNHNPQYDILEGHFQDGSFITYAIKIDGSEESMEYYKGENYGSSGKSYSRHFSADKIPQKFKKYWEELKNIYNEKYAEKQESVNLKENYERLFGKMIVENKLGQRIKTPVANSLTEKEQLRFSNIQKSFQHQYPNKQLRLREGFIIVDNMIVERMETFFKKNNAQISLTLKQYI